MADRAALSPATVSDGPPRRRAGRIANCCTCEQVQHADLARWNACGSDRPASASSGDSPDRLDLPHIRALSPGEVAPSGHSHDQRPLPARRQDAAVVTRQAIAFGSPTHLALKQAGARSVSARRSVCGICLLSRRTLMPRCGRIFVGSRNCERPATRPSRMKTSSMPILMRVAVTVVAGSRSRACASSTGRAERSSPRGSECAPLSVGSALMPRSARP